ncbi:14280_t:CDS:2 [Dentiscutata heterogama]|uniref:14280_t:CDS:1 n=1 Tax=Dentiscutata heterogama TaxID=1316150 RepID=A0ACA9KGT3_9GLOM|nr:14280_t:CDS:2 [Dentiscutata heterogama]
MQNVYDFKFFLNKLPVLSYHDEISTEQKVFNVTNLILIELTKQCIVYKNGPDLLINQDV